MPYSRLQLADKSKHPPQVAKYVFGEAGESVLSSWAIEGVKDGAGYKDCFAETERHAPPSDEGQWMDEFELAFGKDRTCGS